MNLDKRNAVFNNQELSIANMNGLKLIAERNMVKNVPLTYDVDTHDMALDNVGHQNSNMWNTQQSFNNRVVREIKSTQPVTTKVIREVKTTQPVTAKVIRSVQPNYPVLKKTYPTSNLRSQLEQLKIQNNSLKNNIHSSQSDLQGLGNRFREVTMAHQNHIIDLRNKNLYNDKDLNTVNEELGYFQFKNRQNFLQQSTLDRTLSHNMQNDMIDYQLKYLDNYNGSHPFASNALISQIEQSGLENTIIIPSKKIIRKVETSNIREEPIKQISQPLVQEPIRERTHNTRKNMLQNRYTDEIPIRIDKVSKSRDNKTSVISRQYKHSDHVKVILADNDEIIEVPDTQRVDNQNISQLINESMIRKSSGHLL